MSQVSMSQQQVVPNNNQPTQQAQPTLISPNQIDAINQLSSLTKILVEISNILITLRREFRGEALYQAEDGSSQWVQLSKPTFVKVDFVTGRPLRKKINMPWGEEKLTYIPNDEAIDEVLSMLKFAGVNQINPIGINNPDNYLDDLREFECKLAGVLALKQKEWGIDKELLPMTHYKIKTVVQDARSLSVQGNTIKALITSVQRVEQVVEGGENKKKLSLSPY